MVRSMLNNTIIIITVTVAIFISGFIVMEIATPQQPINDVQPLDEKEKIKVFASFYPYYEFTKNVAGDSAIVEQFIVSGTSAHNWEPRAREIQNLQKADAFVYVGLQMEPYIDNILESGEFNNVVFVKASMGVPLLKPYIESIDHGDEAYIESHGEKSLKQQTLHEKPSTKNIANVITDFEENRLTMKETIEKIEKVLKEYKHKDDILLNEIENILSLIKNGNISDTEGIEEIEHLILDYDDHNESEDENMHIHNDSDFIHDPHIWLDPILVKQQANNIRDGLILADPDNALQYKNNTILYNEKLDALDAKIKTELSMCKRDTFISFHNAFTYFADRYELNVVSLSGFVPNADASAAKIAKFVNYAKANDVNVIFAEELVNPRLVEVIADEAGARVLTLSTIETLSNNDMSAGLTYFDKMEQNLDVLKIALECQ